MKNKIRTKDKGRRTREEAQGMKGKGQRTKVEGQRRTREEEPGKKNKRRTWIEVLAGTKDKE